MTAIFSIFQDLSVYLFTFSFLILGIIGVGNFNRYIQKKVIKSYIYKFLLKNKIKLN
jgi:hypothetical protein